MMPLDLDADEHGQAKADTPTIEGGVIAADHTGLFQNPDPTQARGW